MDIGQVKIFIPFWAQTMTTTERLAKIDKVNSQRQPGLVLVLEDIHDPHNAAAILRTADAFGVSRVIFVFDQEKYYNPKKVGASSSSSANKWVPLSTSRSITETLTELKNQDYTTFSTTLSTPSTSIFDIKFSSPKIALLVGNEHRGLSSTAIELSDHHIYIPMRGMVQSLNVSVATAICLFEITRQKL